MTNRTLSALALAVALVACGGNGNQVDGSYRGQSLDVSDGVLFPPLLAGDGSGVSLVVLESESDACTLLQSRPANNTSAMTIVLGIQAPDGRIVPADVAGTYEVRGPLFRKGGTKVAAVGFDVFGGCGPLTTANAVSGKVHVTRAAAASDGSIRGMDGTFAATFDTGESFSGGFHVSLSNGANLAVRLCQ